MLNMKTLQPSEKSLAIYKTIRRNIPENPHILELRLQTLKKVCNPFTFDSEAAHYELKLTSIISRRP